MYTGKDLDLIFPDISYYPNRESGYESFISLYSFVPPAIQELLFEESSIELVDTLKALKSISDNEVTLKKNGVPFSLSLSDYVSGIEDRLTADFGDLFDFVYGIDLSIPFKDNGSELVFALEKHLIQSKSLDTEDLSVSIRIEGGKAAYDKLSIFPYSLINQQHYEMIKETVKETKEKYQTFILTESSIVKSNVSELIYHKKFVDYQVDLHFRPDVSCENVVYILERMDKLLDTKRKKAQFKFYPEVTQVTVNYKHRITKIK